MTTKAKTTDLPSYAQHPLFVQNPDHRSHDAPTFKRSDVLTEELSAPVRELLDSALTEAGFDPTPALRRAVLRRSANTFGATIVAMREAALMQIPDVGEALAGLIGTRIFTANEGPTPSNITRCGNVYNNIAQSEVEPAAPESKTSEDSEGDDEGDDD